MHTVQVDSGSNANMQGVASLTAIDTVNGSRTYSLSRSTGNGTGTFVACRLVYVNFN
jgi:hypothetical protein